MMKKVSAKRDRVQVSLKHVHEIMESVKGKNVDKSIRYLEGVVKEQNIIPFNKYGGKGHKSGVPRGYPKKATRFVISILKELKSNAKVVDLDEASMVIKGYSLGRGAYPRFPSGAVYRRGKYTNLAVFSEAEAKERKEGAKAGAAAAEEKPQAGGQKEESKDNATEEDDKHIDEGAGDKGLPA